MILRRLSLALLALCGCAGPEPAPAPPTLPAALFDATYRGVMDMTVTLEDGRYLGEPYVAGGSSRPTVELLREHTVRVLGDDGSDSQLVVLNASGGGSGNFRYLAAMTRTGERYENTDTVLLGDRVRVVRLSVERGLVEVRLDRARSPGSVRDSVLRRWLLENGRLLAVRDLSGAMVYGHEGRTFEPCDGDAALWLEDATGELAASYEALAGAPYEPVFAELRGVVEAPKGEFARPFGAQLRVLELRRAEREGFGCALKLNGAHFRALGNEPSWRVDVTTSELRLTTPGWPERRFVLPEPSALGQRQYAGREAGGAELYLTLEEARCVDTMSGARFAWSARVILNDQRLEGCAISSPDD